MSVLLLPGILFLNAADLELSPLPSTFRDADCGFYEGTGTVAGFISGTWCSSPGPFEMVEGDFAVCRSFWRYFGFGNISGFLRIELVWLPSLYDVIPAQQFLLFQSSFKGFPAR
jgi:hypothetical protein